MADMQWSKADLQSIEDEGLAVEQVLKQIESFARGMTPLRLRRPCTAGDGIVVIPETERNHLIGLYEERMKREYPVKFVPASGAATRMFKTWYSWLDSGGCENERQKAAFVRDLKKFAFYGDLKEAIGQDGQDIEELVQQDRITEILSYILSPGGLNYGNLPKALLKFHAYPEGGRTALEEHLVEAALYARDSHNLCRLHFTVSPEHEADVRDRHDRLKERYEGRLGVRFELEVSLQQSSTNTIAMAADGLPYRDSEGSLVFRPGGHGALLRNLNLVDGDVIFIKNIDNVVPDRLKPVTALHKKVLAGYLVGLRSEMFRYLEILEEGRTTEDLMEEIARFCRERLFIEVPPSFHPQPQMEKARYLFERLHRPLRVCGMVRNEGEPGGGPFWVEDPEGYGTSSLQIVEEFQVDKTSEAQRAAWEQATHFNPVDLVCAVRDHRGRKFDLNRFVEHRSFCISRKSEKGRELLALELPGLWNGAMAHWNTVFVEVPIETFNPVKTATDLLRPQHLSLRDIDGMSDSD
ncbi:MAG: DUF4301 family protein [Deltaproteobacteria bacterium]|nr:DUF4301 family protein [Deltaproteobacteria bacterium]